MILYSVNYYGPNTNYEWSIVTIHKSLKGAEEAKAIYEKNWQEDRPNFDYKYCIVEIDTDSPRDCIYDYDSIGKDDTY